MQIVPIINRKGGCAKSTTAISLAVYARGLGLRVLLIDTDYAQQTAGHWSELRKRAQARPNGRHLANIPVAPARIEQVQSVLRTAGAKQCDLVIIDTAAAETNALTRMIDFADLCIIPSQPTTPDVHGSNATARLVRSQSKPYRYLLTRVGSGHTKRVSAWRDRYGREGPLLPSQFTNRVAFQDSMAVGLGVSNGRLILRPRGKCAKPTTRSD